MMHNKTERLMRSVFAPITPKIILRKCQNFIEKFVIISKFLLDN